MLSRGRRLRLAGACGVLTVALILSSGCASGGKAGAAGRPSSGPPAPASPVPSAVSAGQLKALAGMYLAIAVPANRRLDAEVDGLADDERDDLAAAESDLRAEASTERSFDARLARIPFPPALEAMVRALIQVNQDRADLTAQQARSNSVAALRSFTGRHSGADASVEFGVRILRRALGLPPPDDS